MADSGEWAVDHFRAMSIFRRVAERGSFSAASTDLGLARGAASAIVAQLEERLGVQLIERTTRSLRLTEDGKAYLERAITIIDEVQALEDEVGAAERQPRGRLRVQIPAGLARLVVAPALPDFFEAYPEVELEIISRNGVPDFIGERIDAAIVVGELPELDIAVRTIGRIPYLTVASPLYLERHGIPATPADLASHNCVALLSSVTRELLPWRFRLPEGEMTLHIEGRACFESSEAAVAAAMRGLGILQLASYLVYQPVRDGHLCPVLETFRPASATMRIVHPRHRFKPRKLRVFEEFLTCLNETTRKKWGVHQVD